MNTRYRFGPFELSPGARQLLANGQPVALGARALDVLLALVERSERLVTKDELLELAWPGLVVEENNLQVQISTLRKLLGPQAIATIPGRGYRFTLIPEDAQVVTPVEAGAAAAKLPPGNLPDLLPTVHGRQEDIARLGELIAQHRMVSIVGA